MNNSWTEGLEANRELWNTWARRNNAYIRHHTDALMRGVTTLRPYEIEEMGDVAGKSLLHLQCHMGADTISWARLGALATGVDYSAESITVARQIAEQVRSEAKFLCADIYDLPEHTDQKFSLVYASRGVLRWLPDLGSWARVVASLLSPGGTFYLTDVHPIFTSLRDDSAEPRIGRPYFARSEPLRESARIVPRDEPQESDPSVKYLWPHSMGELITSLCQAGLTMRFFHEFPWVDRDRPFLRKQGKRMWTLKEGEGELPMYFSLKAEN